MVLTESYPYINLAAQDNVTFSNVRKAIRTSRDDYHKKKLQEWIQTYVKRMMVRWIVLETWRLESVTCVFLTRE